MATEETRDGGPGGEPARGGQSTGEKETETKETETKETPLPSLDFSTFILSLSSSVLISLGVLENPVTKKTEHAPAAAKQTIDLITLLKEKTRGNLTDSESKLIEDLLHELHLQYCKVTEG